MLKIYYRSSKLSGKFSTRPRGTSTDHVVYQFSCPEDDCQSSYIGFATNTLTTRAKQHWYKSSSIHQHFVEAHRKPSQDIPTNIIYNFKILYRNADVFTLKIAESILIRENPPDINVKYNEMSNNLCVE